MTLIEVLIATAIFVAASVAGFETLRALGANVTQLAARAHAAAALNTGVAQLRADAQSARAVWIPNAPCGNVALSLMRSDAAGTAFTTYLMHDGSLERATAAGPIDPCAGDLVLAPVLEHVTSLTARAIAANALSAERDGAVFRASIPAVAVDSHVRDYDGSTIATGNTIVELAIDVDPFATNVDLVAGNRPTGYTLALTYACGARCQANQPTASGSFPEARGLDYRSCAIVPPDLPDSADFYAAAATGLSARGQIVVTQYAVRLRYAYTLDGGTSPPLTVYRAGPTFVWPAGPTLADPYPVDYTANAVKASLAAILASAPPSGLAANDTLCTNLNAERDYRG